MEMTASVSMSGRMKASQLACIDGQVRVKERQHQPSVVLFVLLRQMLQSRGRLLVCHSQSHVITCDRQYSLPEPRERDLFERHNFLHEIGHKWK